MYSLKIGLPSKNWDMPFQSRAIPFFIFMSNMENESSSDIHRSQTAFPNKRRPNHLETMLC